MKFLVLLFPNFFLGEAFALVIPRRVTSIQVPFKTPSMIAGLISSTTKLSVSFVPNQFDANPPTPDNVVVVDDTLLLQNQKQSQQQQGSEEVRAAKRSSYSSINLPLYRSICESHALVLAVTALGHAGLGFVWQQQMQHGILPPLPDQLLPLLLLALASSITTSILLFMNEWITRSSYRPASQIHFATTHLMYSLFGRRQPQDNASSFFSCGLIAFIAAFCQEVTFRGYVLDSFIQATHHDHLGLAVLGQALLYAAVMTVSSTSVTQDEDRGDGNAAAAAGACTVVFGGTWKLIQGIILGMAATAVSESYYGGGGGLWVCILSQWLANWHMWNKTWLQVNHQIDWVESQDLPQVPSAQPSLQQLRPSLDSSALSPEQYQSLYRFYCAFDISHQHALSLEDVQRAISYAFWHTKNAPTQKQVKELVLSRRTSTTPQNNNQDDNGENVQLDFDEFLAVLFSLRTQSLGIKA